MFPKRAFSKQTHLFTSLLPLLARGGGGRHLLPLLNVWNKVRRSTRILRQTEIGEVKRQNLEGFKISGEFS